MLLLLDLISTVGHRKEWWNGKLIVTYKGWKYNAYPVHNAPDDNFTLPDPPL